MARKIRIPIKVDENKVTAEVGEGVDAFDVSATIPNKYKKYTKYAKWVLLALVIIGSYFGYQIIVP